MPSDAAEKSLERKIRILLVSFIVGLTLSGLTAFPLPQELNLLAKSFGLDDGGAKSLLGNWILQVRDALNATEAKFPFLFYGYDWLAFAHLVIAVLFLGPINDPVRNVWVIQWGMIACLLVIPLALIFGPIRGIPFYWRLIDCSFGVVGIVPLAVCLKWTRKLERINSG